MREPLRASIGAATMANASAVIEILGRLTKAPVRTGGILDVPFGEYAELVASDDVVELLSTYARRHPRPTLRAVLGDEHFRRWLDVAGRSRLRAAVEEELALIRDVVDEEYILDEDDEEEDQGAKTTPPSLREWAERAGVGGCLHHPAAVLAPRATGDVGYALRSERRATVADVVEGRVEAFERLAPSQRRALVAVAEGYVREAGEIGLADRREEERIAALAYVPKGDGAREFLAALGGALPKTKHATHAHVSRASLETDPLRIEVQAVVPSAAGRKRNPRVALLLEGWRQSPLGTKVTGDRKLTHVALRGARRVLADPRHPSHARLVGYLNEPPWRRVLARLDVVREQSERHERPELRVTWEVSAERSAHVTALVHDADGPPRSMSADALVRSYAASLSSRDEAVARALCDPATLSPYGYYAHTRSESRERTFRALSLLAASEQVRGRRRGALAVREGSLDAAVEQDEAGFRFVFEVSGERLGATDVRTSLDADGYLIHVDESRGRVLLAYVGTKRAAVLAAMTAEDAVFPEDVAARMLTVRAVVPLRVPEALAGERVDADPRPHVRLVRDSPTSMTLSWFVRPIAHGPMHSPGEGPEQVLFEASGRAVFAMRARDEERRRLDALRARLPISIASGPLDGARCQGLEAMLAAADVLRHAVEAGEAIVEWPRSLPRVTGTASFEKLKLVVSSERDWFGVRGSVDVDGVEITLADLLAARRAREPFVVVGPDKLVAIGADLRARLDAIDAVARPASSNGAEQPTLELARAAVPALVDVLESRRQLAGAPAFFELLARIDSAHASEPKLPRGFRKILRPYQVDGFRWMSRLAAWGAGACLADEMGLGKTVQALAILAARAEQGPALVVAPTSVGPNWIRETERFAPSLRAILHRGAGRDEALAKLGPRDVLVTSYDIAVRDRERLSNVVFATLIADEAQAIKNGATARANALRSLRANFRLALTGTPVENRVAELHSLMEFLNPGFFGREDAFRARYVLPIERDKDAAVSAALARAVRPFLLRRKKSDVLTELPARTEVVRAVERTTAERKLYEAARRVALESLSDDDERARFNVLAEIMRLRRLACHPKLYDESSKVPSSKLEAFVGLVDELRAEGHRALVFSQFTGHLALVEEALRARAIPYLYLDGKTPLRERTKRVAAFQAGEAELFLISLKAGGTGLNLTAADTVVHLDPWWNPAVEDQATDRAHRIGQTRPVTVVRLVAQGTIEEAVLALHADKRELAEAILEGASATGKLSMAELGALIREGATA